MDLTKNPPRSPKIPLGGIVALPRFIDKAQASVGGKLGEYKLGAGSALDQRLIAFLGIDLNAFLKVVADGADDQALIDWIKANGTHQSDVAIQKWSQQFRDLLAKDDPDRQQYINIVLEKTGLDPAKTTTFDWLDFDDAHTFPAKAP